jgi:hypothetical protein
MIFLPLPTSERMSEVVCKGIWMLHCHNFLHANRGMDTMVMYDVSTPYVVGSESGNFPD